MDLWVRNEILPIKRDKISMKLCRPLSFFLTVSFFIPKPWVFGWQMGSLSDTAKLWRVLGEEWVELNWVGGGGHPHVSLCYISSSWLCYIGIILRQGVTRLLKMSELSRQWRGDLGGLLKNFMRSRARVSLHGLLYKPGLLYYYYY